MHLLLADDHGLFRDSMAVWLKQLDENMTIDFADTLDSVRERLHHTDYDLLMMDLGMPGMQGAVSIQQLCSQLKDTHLMIVSADENSQTIRSCIDAGAAGYVTKSSSGETILLAVKQVLSGVRYLPIDLDKANTIDLSDKQKQILAHLAEGLSNKGIAKKMYLSEGTIKQYVTVLLRLLRVDNRMQAGLKARELLGICR
ncbi:MAG: response regulator transcription factor [Gammaproteobacteria bacterium]|nr:response regulator transcription factor [Gammaproteobacteria bacterium]MCF6230319.1 response regulator transcription factor [Gammaproteobacteria bacterium]